MSAAVHQIVAAEARRVPQAVMEAPSMLSYDERALLHWAAREGGPDEGAIIDAGCFLGGSTLALGYGVRARDPARTSARIASFDLFKIGDERERVYFAADYPFVVGASTLDLYQQTIAPIADRVTVHSGDIAGGEAWTEPISVLFIDVAKSWDTNDAVLRRFFGALQPGALVVQQDLVHFGHPWCAITMELLSDRFEFLGFVPFSSAVYRARGPIPIEECPLDIEHRVSVEEMAVLIRRGADRIGDPAGGYLRLAEATARTLRGQPEAAIAVVDAVERDPRYRKLPWIEQHIATCREFAERTEANDSGCSTGAP